MLKALETQRFPGFFFFDSAVPLLRKFDALYPIFNGLTIGENRVWSDEWVKK